MIPAVRSAPFPPSPLSQHGGAAGQSNETNSQTPATPPLLDSAADTPSPQRVPASKKAAGSHNEPSPSRSAMDQVELSHNEQEDLRKMQERDAEVRAHEQAHHAAGGGHTGTPTYSFERGPDGQLYAADGEVTIDTSPVPDDPQATVEKMQVVRRAALAPASPSSQDRKVAAEAIKAENQARAEIAEKQRQQADIQNDRSAATPEELTKRETSHADATQSFPPGQKMARAVATALEQSGLAAYGREADTTEVPKTTSQKLDA